MLIITKPYYVNIKSFFKLTYRKPAIEQNDTIFELVDTVFVEYLPINKKTVFGPKVKILHNYQNIQQCHIQQQALRYILILHIPQ